MSFLTRSRRNQSTHDIDRINLSALEEANCDIDGLQFRLDISSLRNALKPLQSCIPIQKAIGDIGAALYLRTRRNNHILFLSRDGYRIGTSTHSYEIPDYNIAALIISFGGDLNVKALLDNDQ